MNKLDYRKTVRSDGFTQIVRRDPETHKYQRWTSGRPEWFTHVDDPGVFIGFTDFIRMIFQKKRLLKPLLNLLDSNKLPSRKTIRTMNNIGCALYPRFLYQSLYKILDTTSCCWHICCMAEVNLRRIKISHDG